MNRANYLWAILALAVTGAASSPVAAAEIPAVQACMAIERNIVCDTETGGFRFLQFVFWDIDGHVADFYVLRGGQPWPLTKSGNLWHFQVIGSDNMPMVIVARVSYETVTDFDREVVERGRRPYRERRGLGLQGWQQGAAPEPGLTPTGARHRAD